MSETEGRRTREGRHSGAGDRVAYTRSTGFLSGVAVHSLTELLRRVVRRRKVVVVSPLGPGLAHYRAARDRADLQRAWVGWLAATGYGVDYSSSISPPCTRRELAKAYHHMDPTDESEIESIRAWEWCIAESTGALS